MQKEPTSLVTEQSSKTVTNIYTIQMSKWRLIKDTDIELIDVTVKSGVKAFAPSWDLLRAYKDGLINKEEYTIFFDKLMEESKVKNKQEWLDLLVRPKIAVSCFCSGFCHRYLVADHLGQFAKENDIPFIVKGDVVSPISNLGI